MEKKKSTIPCTDNELHAMLVKAKKGDSLSLQQLIDCFMPDIMQLVFWTGMPKEDAMQSIIVEFISFIKNASFQKNGCK